MVNRIRENIDPNELVFDEKNANKGTERGQYQLEISLSETGPGKAPVVDKDGNIIAGNKTVEMARRLGIPITVVESRGEELIVHKRMDLDLTDPLGSARKMAFLDNRTSEVGLEWDSDAIASAYEAGLDVREFWWPSELDALGVTVEEIEPDAMISNTKEDRKRPYYPESQDEPVQAGQVYSCGNHRLFVNESIKPGDADVMLKAFEQFTGQTCEIYSMGADEEDAGIF